jgi:hypothetical protein
MPFHPYSQAATDFGQTGPDREITCECFICGEEFTALEPRMMGSNKDRPVCCFCQLRSRDRLLEMIIEEREERLDLERRLEKIWYDNKHKGE